jgi:hypothetical protein
MEKKNNIVRAEVLDALKFFGLKFNGGDILVNLLEDQKWNFI